MQCIVKSDRWKIAPGIGLVSRELDFPLRVSVQLVPVLRRYVLTGGGVELYRGDCHEAATLRQSSYISEHYEHIRRFESARLKFSLPETELRIDFDGFPEMVFELVLTPDGLLVRPGVDSTNRCLLFAGATARATTLVALSRARTSAQVLAHGRSHTAIEAVALLDVGDTLAFVDSDDCVGLVTVHRWDGCNVVTSQELADPILLPDLHASLPPL